MKKIFLSILICFLISTVAHAELWVCTNSDGTRRASGDGFKLGITGKNNSNINPNCIEATQQEYDLSGRFKKIDKSVVSGPRVVDMTQAEKDAITTAEQAAKDAAKLAKQQLRDDDLVKDRSNITLTKVDNAIDNISNLNDAKIFLKKLVRYIIDSNEYIPNSGE